MPARPLPPIGFWSYARPDDELSGGQLSRLRSLIRAELQQQYGREQVQLFQDISAISHGSRWEGEIRRALENSTFFIPILSPNFLQSEWCVQEVEIFQERQERLFDEHPGLPRTSRIFPVHFIDVTGVEGLRPDVDAALKELQWFDFREHRHSDFNAAEVRRTVSSFVTSVRDLLRVQVEQPEDIAPPPRSAPPAAAAAKPAPSPAPIEPAPAGPSPLPEPASPGGTGDGGGGAKLPLLIGGGIAALLTIGVLLYFLVIRQASETPAAAANSAAATNNIAANSGAAEPEVPVAEQERDLALAMMGRWGDDRACTTGLTYLLGDGTLALPDSGRWSTSVDAQREDVLRLDYEGSESITARIEWLDEEGQAIRLHWPDEAPTAWYRCQDQTEPPAP